MTHNPETQATHFDDANHRFDPNQLKNPSYVLEMETLEKYLNVPKKSTIVDFGSGNGRVSLFFLKKGYNVIAVDISKKSLEELKIIYKKNKTNNWGKLTTQSTLPKSADGIVGADILHHINLREFLPQLFRTLKKGGRIAFSEPNGQNPLWYFYLLISRLPWAIEKGITTCTASNLKKQFHMAGFTDIRVIGHGLLISFGNVIISPLAFRLLVTATK